MGLLLALFTITLSSVSWCQNLYPSQGPFIQIQSSKQFSDTVYESEKASFVQFYSSQDQNSISFAPIWKKLAGDTAGWTNVVQLVAVDCELDANAVICKENNLNTYPTLKYFKYQSTSPQDGQLYDGKMSKAKELEAAIARFVLADFGKQKPSNWPDFTLAHDHNPGENLWHHETHYLALIFEKYSADRTFDTMPVIGAQIMLDFSSDQNVWIRRGTSKHQLALANDVRHFPGLLMFSRSHEGSPVYASKESLTREEIATKMRRYMDVESPEHDHRHAQREDL